MKARRAWIIAAAAVAVTACLAYGSADNIRVFTNNIRTSDVQVRVQQLRETDEGLKEISGSTACMPGEKSSYVPRVTVLGQESYVRLHLLAEANEGSDVSIGAGDAYGINDEWIVRGGWLYCTRSLKPGEYSDVMEGIRVPQVTGGKEFTGFRTVITADAIQAANFTPDFNSEQPWGPVTIQASRSQGTVAVREAAQSKGHLLSLNSDGSSECSAEDLFAGFGDLMPGDLREDKLTIRNGSGKKTAVYFRTDNKPSELLARTGLRIECGGNLIYEGDLLSAELQKPVELAALEPGQSIDFRYRLKFPEDADNSFQDLGRSVRWIFEQRKPAKGQAQEPGGIVRTGDSGWIKILAAALICALTLAALTLLIIKRGKNGKGN